MMPKELSPIDFWWAISLTNTKNQKLRKEHTMSGSHEEKAGGSSGVQRTLRHKERQRYLDDEGLTPTLDGSEGGEGPGFNLEEKLNSAAYNADLVKEIKTAEFNLKYLQQHGFHTPLLFRNKEGLGLKVSALGEMRCESSGLIPPV